MPGIVGIITKLPREWAEPQLERMVEALRHELSYTSGTWVDESLGIYAGWAERQSSFSNAGPLENEKRNLLLLLSGEDYSGPDTKNALKEQGHDFPVEGPSYLVHLAEGKKDFPRPLNGRFHGLLIDRACGLATLFNDRYGLQRLYVHEAKEGLYFAAEAKAILTVRPELRSPEHRAFGEFISCGCTLEGRTLFKNIQVLPPASFWTFQSGVLQKKEKYFGPSEWENQDPLTSEQYYQELRRSLSANLPRYFNGPGRVGVSLTGGLDTRMILAWHPGSPGALPCYSFGGPIRECQDVSLARRIAGICQQPFEVIPMADEFFTRFAHYAERAVFLTDGCVNVNRSSDLYLNEKAAHIAPVRMTGNYGSEILRRLRAFKPGKLAAGLFRPEFLSHVSEAAATYDRLTSGHALSFIAFAQVPWHHYGLFALEQTQVTMRSPYLDNDVVRAAFRMSAAGSAKTDIFEDSHDCNRLIAEGNPSLARIRTDRGLGGNFSPLRRAVTRAWLEFTFKAEYAYDYGMPEWVARIDHQLSWLHLEHIFLGRHKFNHYRIWYRDALSGYVREMLLDSRTLSRPYLDRNRVEFVVNAHLKGDHNFTTEIHQLLTLELIHRLFFDAN